MKVSDDTFLAVVAEGGTQEVVAAKLGMTTQSVSGRLLRLERKRAISLVRRFVDWIDDDGQALPDSALVKEAREFLRPLTKIRKECRGCEEMFEQLDEDGFCEECRGEVLP